MDSHPDLSARSSPRRDLASWPFLDHCATAMAIVDRDCIVLATNQAFCDWLGSGSRSWRGETVAMLDTQKPPQLVDAAMRANGEQRRIWLRDARLRTAIGDRAADLAFTPIEADLLIELHASAAETSSLRLSESLRGPAARSEGTARRRARRPRSCCDGIWRRQRSRSSLPSSSPAEVDRVAALSDRLLRAGAKPRLARTNIHEALERVAALIAAEASAPRVRRDYDPSLPAINADADRLQQALLNLARNAVEAGAQSIALRTRAGARRCALTDRTLRLALRIDVGDDGRGVPADLAETLFEPLVSGRADGSGLGLAIAREIARAAYGGDLTYTSRPGATVFTLMLPVSDEGARGSATTRISAKCAEAARTAWPTQKPTVWIVDGDRSVRLVLGAALREAGFTPREFGDAESALAALVEETPAVLYTDSKHATDQRGSSC